MRDLEIITDFSNALFIFMNSGLFLDEVRHGLVSIAFALAFYYKFRDKKLSFLIVFMTYLIDIDHLVDYFLYYGPQFSFSQFIRLENFAITKRAFVPFHAWEWAVMLSLLSIQYKKHRKTYIALATGLVAHLTWDTITVGSVMFYSIIYRIMNSFVVIN